jgi:hypothetical protein
MSGEKGRDRRGVSGELNLRPQAVYRQPLDQRVPQGDLHIQPAAILATDDEHVEEQPPLRRQQRAKPGLADGQRLDVLGQLALQE